MGIMKFIKPNKPPTDDKTVMISMIIGTSEKKNITNGHRALITEGLFFIIAFKPINKKTVAFNNKKSEKVKNRLFINPPIKL
jgi:hypothetical protein